MYWRNFEQLIICKSQLSCYGLVNISSTDQNSIQSLIQLKHEILQTLLSEVQRGIDYFNQWGETSQVLWEHLIYQNKNPPGCPPNVFGLNMTFRLNFNYQTHIKTLSLVKKLQVKLWLYYNNSQKNINVKWNRLYDSLIIWIIINSAVEL